MSIVAPNGQVRLFKDVPLDDKFEDTLWFESKQAQTNYFLSLTPVHTMYNATRVRDGVIAVDVGEDSIRDCNYLMFQNMNFSDKWFYAFIKGTEYVNNNMTYVTYEIDPLETYGFDITLLDCLVEREHTLTDNIGDNIVGENMGGCELVISRLLDPQNLCDSEVSGVTYDKLIALYTSSIYDGQGTFTSSPIGVTDGIANGSMVSVFDYNDDGTGGTSAVENRIEALTRAQQSDSIIGGYILPARLFTPYNTTDYFSASGEYIHDDNGSAVVTEINFNTSNAYASLDTYVPKNNKMFTAPFNWIYLMSTDGQMIVLQPQYLGNKNNVKLKNYHCITGVPEARLVLQSYKGEAESSENYFTFADFPQLGYAIDGYKAWLASGGEKKLDLAVSQVTRQQELAQSQTKFNATLSAVKDSAQIIKGGVQVANALTSNTARKGQLNSGVGNIAEGTMSAISDIGNAIYTLEASQQTIQFANENADLQRSIAKSLPSAYHGAVSNTSLLASKNLTINAEQRCVNRQTAKVIDDYFTMFGYALNQVKKPTLHNRSRYTYVKTIGCKVQGGAPTDMITKIEGILNSGCRFWADHEHVRDYSYADNVPLGV